MRFPARELARLARARGQIDLYCRSIARPPHRIVLDIDGGPTAGPCPALNRGSQL